MWGPKREKERKSWVLQSMRVSDEERREREGLTQKGKRDRTSDCIVTHAGGGTRDCIVSHASSFVFHSLKNWEPVE